MPAVLVESRLVFGTRPGSCRWRRLLARLVGRICLGRLLSQHGQSVRCRAARIEGNLDDKRVATFSPGDYRVLGGTRAVGIGPAAVSYREYFRARGVCGFALAGVAGLARTGRMAGRGVMGAASVAGRIGSVDFRDEEHAVVPVLSFDDFFLCAMAANKRCRAAWRKQWRLCVDVGFRRHGDGQQIVDGCAAGDSLLVRVVDGGPVAVASSCAVGADLSDVGFFRRAYPVAADIGSGGGRSPMGAELAGASLNVGRCNLVLSGKADLAASVDGDLSALADRWRAMDFVFAAIRRSDRFVCFMVET